MAKENTYQSSTPPTQCEERIPRIGGYAPSSASKEGTKLTALLHHLTTEVLRDSFYALKRQVAPGVDGVPWQEYEAGVEDRIQDLHSRGHRGAYRAQPLRRVYIPKADGRQRPDPEAFAKVPTYPLMSRPLQRARGQGLAALEDKVVQQAVVTILNQGLGRGAVSVKRWMRWGLGSSGSK